MNFGMQQFMDGLATGSVYGMVGLSLVLIYRGTGILNFAQGEMTTFATFIGWTLIVSVGMPYWSGFVLTIVIALLLGALVQVVVIRPVQHASPLTVIIVTLGLFFLFNSLTLKVWGSKPKSFPTPFPEGSVEIFGGSVSWVSLGIFAVALLTMVLVGAFFRFTSTGLAMRAVTSNPSASSLMGINNDRVRILGWALAAGISAVAGMLVANKLLLDPNMMLGVLIYAFAAAVLGGLSSPLGAVIGGLIMGEVGAMASGISAIGSELSTAVTVVAIVGVLLIRPSGLLGEKTVVRV